jgi:hypothetical protein
MSCLSGRIRGLYDHALLYEIPNFFHKLDKYSSYAAVLARPRPLSLLLDGRREEYSDALFPKEPHRALRQHILNNTSVLKHDLICFTYSSTLHVHIIIAQNLYKPVSQ